MRQWVTPRALLLHLAFVVVAGGCLIAGWWQVHRAMSGNTLSYLYSIEWPAFAVVAGIGWWQMVHDTPEDLEARRAYRERARAAAAEVVARTLPRSALAITTSSEEVDTSHRLEPATPGSLPDGAAAALGDGRPTAAGGEVLPAVASGPAELAGQVPAGAAGQVPAGAAQPVPAELLPDEDGAPLDDLAAYNRYLALLAVRGKAKTWRNPHGV